MSSYIIGISGPSASGKTYFLKSMRKLFSEDEVCIISLDNYYFPLDKQQADEEGELNFDLPEAVDIKGFTDDLIKISNGQSVIRPEYTFNNPAANPAFIELKPAPVIMAEGLFIFYFEEIRKLLDLGVFIDCSDSVRLQRRIERDKTERGLTEEIILYQWRKHVLPAYERYLLPYRDQADIIINNDIDFEQSLELVVDKVKAILQ